MAGSDCASAIACSTVIVEPIVFSRSHASSPEHHHELAFEVTFEFALAATGRFVLLSGLSGGNSSLLSW